MSEEMQIVTSGPKSGSKDRVRADRTDLLYKDIPEGETLMKIDSLHVVYRTDDKETVAVDESTGEVVQEVIPDA